MSNLIIVDRKAKRKHSDTDWTDPFDLEQVHKDKARTIDVPNESQNPIHRFLREYSVRELIGKKVYCVTAKAEILSGRIQDVIPPDFIHIRRKGVARIKDCISLETGE